MDYLSLKSAVAEIGSKLNGSRINDAWQAGGNEVVLTTHRGSALLLSCEPARPGLYLLDLEIIPERTPSPFTDLLRARIKGTTLMKVELTEPGERIVTFTFASAWPARESTPLKIIFEVMGRRSNLMVIESGKILQPLRVVPREKSPARPVIPGETYHAPPLRKGIPVEEVTTSALEAAGPEDIRGSLTSAARGLSTYTAHQAVMKAVSGTGEEVVQQALARVLQEMVSSSDGSTGYLHSSGGKTYLSPFEPELMHPADTIESCSPFSIAALKWRISGPSNTVEGGDEAAILGEKLAERIRRIDASLDKVGREEERCQAHNDIRVMAETLLIHAGGIDPGADTVKLPDPYDPGLEITIGLDQSKNPLENANDLFSRARRLRRGLEEVASRREKLIREKKDLQAAMDTLLETDDPEPARKILDLKASETVTKGRTPQYSYSGPGRKHTIDGFTILVGKSSNDNEKVTFRAAGHNDLWLHARDYPGSHVVILCGKKQVPDKVLYAAAALAAKGSGAKNDTAPEIMVTERKWVKKLKGGKPGQVTVEKFRTIRPRRNF